MTQNLSHFTVNGIDMAVWDWPGQTAPVLLCHATGFHGRCWDQIVARLDGHYCLAPEFRGHGRSGKPAPPYSWRQMGDDLTELVDRLGLRGAIGVGHSMGGHALTVACAHRPGAFSRLLLLDPVILPESAYRGATEPLDFVLRRKNTFASTGEMFDRFKGRPPFSTWDEAVLRDYCDYGLIGTALACPPEVEASIYAHSAAPDANIYAEIGLVTVPVHVVRSRESYEYGKFEGSPAWPGLAGRFRHGTDEHRTDVSHFIPMEAPGLTAELILKL